MLSIALPFLASAALSCVAIDGDTLRCGPAGQSDQIERVRLTGIDAPELPGHCAPWRQCVAGDARASKAHLAALVQGKPVALDRAGTDRYGRTLATAHAGGLNLACAQLHAGHAVYIARWDSGGRVRRQCRPLDGRAAIKAQR